MDTHSEEQIADVIHSAPKNIGSILVDAGRISRADAEEIYAVATRKGTLFGRMGVQLKLLTPADIKYALSQQFNCPIVLPGTGSRVSRDVIAAYLPQAPEVEQLRTIRTRLLIGWMSKVGRAVLAVTSPERREGRTWLSANLATMFAQTGRKTLLVDADLRNPNQHRLFNLDNSIGLSSLLTGRVESKDLIRRIDPDLRLFVLTAGAPAPNPQELLSKRGLDIVVQHLSKRFDLVVIDTPAAAETSDAELLAASAGAALMLSRRNRTKRRTLLGAMESLQRSGVEVIGSVVNES